MDDARKGTWLINTARQLTAYVDSVEKSEFENSNIAGRTGIFLGKLVAAETEILTKEAIQAFAKASGLNRFEQKEALKTLKAIEKVDYSETSGEVEVFCFSTRDAVVATSLAFEKFAESSRSDVEDANLLALDATFALPRTGADLKELLTGAGFREERAELVITLQETFSLVGTSKLDNANRKIYFNYHTFAGKHEKIVKGIQALPNSKQSSVLEMLDLVVQAPGTLRSDLVLRFGLELVDLAEGIGIIDCLEVVSPIGSAQFCTAPHLKGIQIEAEDDPLVKDTFHHAKALLCCLRFGQEKSTYNRGRIDTQQKLLNIVNSLLRGGWVGPATAIGEDYTILEREGVIETRRGEQYGRYMRLRKPEVGKMVQQMILTNFVDTTESKIGAIELSADKIVIPEVRRRQLAAKCNEQVAGVFNDFMRDLRTR